MTTGVMTVLALVFESNQWVAPTPSNWFAIVFNAVLVFGFAHAAWFYLARSLPPVASVTAPAKPPLRSIVTV